MPEGPSIVILKEAAEQFSGQQIIAAETDGRIDFDIDRLNGQKIISLKTWGKHFLICFKDFTIRIHLLMFGKYFINDRKDATPRIGFNFKAAELNFYTCSVKLLEGDVNQYYDWKADLMNEQWNARAAKKKVRSYPGDAICDLLLDQTIFAGSGNIIKNEVLYRARIHPQSLVGAIPDAKLRELITAVRDYSFEFLEQKKKGQLKRNWKIYTRKKCARCDLPVRKEYTGKLKRRSFFCERCQHLYS
jgi:endonuclease VIII